MACTTFLTDGRPLNCKNTAGGLKTVYFIRSTREDWTVVDKEISNFTGVYPQNLAYKFVLKGNSSFEQTINASEENRTTFYEQVLNLTLPKLSKVDQDNLENLSQSEGFQVIIEDYNDNFFVMGLEHQVAVTGGTVVSGASMGDMSGYTLTLTGMEQDPALLVSPTTQTETEWTFSGGDTLTIDLN